ncbi:hypothetical protein C8R44DRAFT_742153 [Mycena epipterygia]|nr:hypothetical protein C8R44DRAFT_742153 [Mycena epipterygia]
MAMPLPIVSSSTTADEVPTVFSEVIQGKNALRQPSRMMCRRPTYSFSMEIHKAAAEINAYPEPLHVLIHNAAAAMGNFKFTVDNLEMQMATDHISPFLLTKLFVPKLLAAGTTSYTPHVVFISSGAGAVGAGINFNTIGNPTQRKCEHPHRYRAVQAIKGRVMRTVTLHPGIIFTNMCRKEEPMTFMKQFGILGPNGLPNTKQHEWKTIPQGAATTLAAAFDTRFDDKPSTYLSDSSDVNEVVAPQNSDPVNAEKVIIGESFTF